MKLYKLINGLGEWFVLAEHPTAALEKLHKHLDKQDYGITSRREVQDIHLLAKEMTDDRFITGNYLLTNAEK